MNPAALRHLTEGGQLLLWGVRHWMVAMLQLRAVPPSVLRAFEVAGGGKLCEAMSAMLLLAARDADRPLVIFPPCSQELSCDEERLARILAAMTAESPRVAGGHWRALLGAEPSAALSRCARLVAEAFRCSGLRIALLDEPVDRALRAVNN